MKLFFQRLLQVTLAGAVVSASTGCAVVEVAGAAAGAAINVAGAVVSTGVQVTGKVVGAGIDAVSGAKK